MATFDSAYPAGTVVQIASGDEVIATWTADKYSRRWCSRPRITSGESYTVYVGGKASGTAVGGMTLGGSTSGATKLGTVTAGQDPAGRGRP